VEARPVPVSATVCGPPVVRPGSCFRLKPPIDDLGKCVTGGRGGGAATLGCARQALSLPARIALPLAEKNLMFHEQTADRRSGGVCAAGAVPQPLLAVPRRR
jgi:hypothetical protein